MALINVLQGSGTASKPIPVTEDMLSGSSVSTAATSPYGARDQASTATDVANPIMLIRRDSPTAITPVAGDYEIPQVNSLGAQWIQPMLGPFGGALQYSKILALDNNAALIKAGQSNCGTITYTNNSANWAFIKLFNKATAPVPGTDTPVATFGMPPNSATDIGFQTGTTYPLGLGIAVTGGLALNDNTPNSATGCVNLAYA